MILRRDPLWRLVCLGRDDNIDVVHEGLLRLAIWRLTSLNGGERPKHLTLDIDGRTRPPEQPREWCHDLEYRA